MSPFSPPETRYGPVGGSEYVWAKPRAQLRSTLISESIATHRMQTSADAHVVGLAAERLYEAQKTGVACWPVRDLIGPTNVRAAYAVQTMNVARRLQEGSQVVGRKIGLTSQAVQAKLGVDQPGFGVLLDEMWCASDRPVDLTLLVQPRVEAQIAFVMSQDVLDPAVESDSIRSCVDNAVAALEIVDSRIEGWDIAVTDMIADNASSGLFVLGRTARPLTEFEPRDVQMTMSVNGSIVSTGGGKQCLGGPLEALAWLARTALESGVPLRTGDIVLAGALGPMVTLQPGDSVDVELTGLGEMHTTFAAKGAQR